MYCGRRWRGGGNPSGEGDRKLQLAGRRGSQIGPPLAQLIKPIHPVTVRPTISSGPLTL